MNLSDLLNGNSPAAQTFLAQCRETTGPATGTDTLQLPFIS